MISIILNAAALILLGLLAIPSLVLKKKPNAKELFDKIAPYQGIVGIIAAIWGLWGLIWQIVGIGAISYAPLWWIFGTLVCLVVTALGFILGYGLIQKYALSKNEAAKEKGEQVLKKLLPLQGTLGIISIVLGIAYILFYFIVVAAVAVAIAM